MSRCFRIRVPALCDIVVASDPEQIRWLVEHPLVSRPIDPAVGPLHRFVHRRLAVDLGFDHGVLPVFLPRDDRQRAARQAELAQLLDAAARRGSEGPELDDMIRFIAGTRERDIGPSVQQWCGRLFSPGYRSTEETYRAGRTLAEWPALAPWKAWKARASGQLDEAKRRVAQAARGDLHAIHGTSIGMENIARTLRAMRKAARRPELANATADRIIQLCLAAPPALLRGVRGEVEVPFLERPLTRQTLVVLLLGRAHAHSGDADVAFLGKSWSGCPAHGVVVEMLRAAWRAARREEVAKNGASKRHQPWASFVRQAASGFEGRLG